MLEEAAAHDDSGAEVAAHLNHMQPEGDSKTAQIDHLAGQRDSEAPLPAQVKRSPQSYYDKEEDNPSGEGESEPAQVEQSAQINEEEDSAAGKDDSDNHSPQSNDIEEAIPPENTEEKPDGDEEENSEKHDAIPFPLGRVKRIVRLDKDIKLVSRPGLATISHACQLFIENLTTDAFSEMVKAKRKSLRLVDLEAAVRRKPECMDFLEDCMDIFQVKKDTGLSDGEEDGQDSKMKEKSASNKKVHPPPPPPGTRCITDFFGGSSSNSVHQGT